MEKIYAVYGASGFGREVMPLVRDMLRDQINIQFVFIDDGLIENKVNEHKVTKFAFRLNM